MEKTYDLNEEQLELVRLLINRWVIELEDVDTWTDIELPRIMQQDMHEEVEKARELALSVQELLNDN